ncbi:MAG TPA: hypothetical protein VJH03_07255 [Blastocatellia bacterium]|nr:hypothetical protein [Blastocatellia bacterium]
MNSKPATGYVAIAFLFLSVIAVVGCSTPQPTANSGAGDSNVAAPAAKKSSTPPEAKPMGAVAPGYFSTGYPSSVALRFTSPRDGETIEGNSVAPTFDIGGFPIYYDPERKKGQHIAVILDNGPAEADYDPAKPFSPESGAFNNLKPGIHTLRAFPVREWHESIKQPDGFAFAFVVFKVGAKGDPASVNKQAPLLTCARPAGNYHWKEDPRGLMLDFYVSNAKVSGNDYKVKYTLNDKPSLVTRWDPVWWPWDNLGLGLNKIVVELLDKNNKPVPFMAGGVNYNRVERTFLILAMGEQAPATTPR